MFEDDFFASLTMAEQLLFIYFLFNLNVNIIHLYEISPRKILFDLKVTAENLENAKNKFQANKKIYFYKNYVYIANAYRYQKYTGEDNEKAKDRLYERLPKDVLDWYYSISDTPVTPLLHPLKSKPQSYKKELLDRDTNTEEEIDFDEVDKYLELKKTAKN